MDHINDNINNQADFNAQVNTIKDDVNSQSNFNIQTNIINANTNTQGDFNTQDMNSGEVVVLSNIRSGMKREFAMTMRAQSEIGALPMGRRRVTTPQNVGKVDKKGKGCDTKRLKKADEEENVEIVDVSDDSGEDSGEIEKFEADFGAGILQPLCMESPLLLVGSSDGDLVVKTVEGASDCEALKKRVRRFTRTSLKEPEEGAEVELGGRAVENSTTSPSKLEMKMSKKVELKGGKMRLKDLLKTGLLEGLPVRYGRGSKALDKSEPGLRGVIRGTGILCSCNECGGEKVVTPNQFELHANSGNRRPPEYIYLESGKSLRGVLNACKDEQSDSLERVIRNAVGGADSGTTALCVNCKGLVPEGGIGRSTLLCDSCAVPKETDLDLTQTSAAALRSPFADLSSPVASTSRPAVRESGQISSSKPPKEKPQGKLTRKDLRLHKYVLADDVLPEGAALSYVMHGKKRRDGYKKDNAIFCKCCNHVVSPSQFEAHAGFALHRRPYHNIFTSNGVSLHELAIELAKNRESSTVENDVLCQVCMDGGDLLYCENCPRSFHLECVGITSTPEGKWYCKYCKDKFDRETFSERSANAIAAGRVAGTDPLREITERCIRIVGTFEAEAGGCAICRDHGFSKSGFNDRTVIICDQCEKEYHVGCLREKDMDDLKALPIGDWFCCTECSQINSALQKLIGEGEQKLPEDLLDLVRKKQGLENTSNLDLKWRLMRGKTPKEDTRAWLSGAVSIFHNRFDPISDGNRDLILDMVYGRRFKNQDFCGMYCAILMVDSVTVSAAIFRVFGEEVAEIPLVATKTEHEGKGYVQCLHYCIENLLASLNVKDLMLPSSNDAMWTNKFGFGKIDAEQIYRPRIANFGFWSMKRNFSSKDYPTM